MIQERIGFIGAGNMAEAIIRGLLERGTCQPVGIAASDVNQIRLAQMVKTYGILSNSDSRGLAAACRVLVLAVKPQQAADVLKFVSPALDPQRHVLLSIAAGLTTAYIEKVCQAPLKVVRVMPNTPAQLLAGAAAFCLGQFAGEAEALLAQSIFESVGVVVRVEENLMNAVTALSGSGPAYVFRLAELMMAAGERMGIPLPEAKKLTIQTILGAARMLAETDKTAADLRHAVTSPGGTTEAALTYLAASDFADVFLQAVLAARDRGAGLTPQPADEA